MKFNFFKRNWLKIISILLFVLALIFLAFFLLSPKTNLNGNVISTPTISINYSNFEKEIAKNYVIQALPDNSKILLKFYNFNTGERQWENSFILNRANVTKGSIENPDMTLSLSSAYLKELTNKNFCQIIQTANNNGDLGVEYGLFEAGLAWKYRSILKYKSCFGM